MDAADLEVIVAGAGPAGISAALAVVRRSPQLAGRVLVLDRARFPRDKPCGGGLTGHAEEAMAALGLALTVPSFPSPRAEVRYGSYRREVALERPVRIVERRAFDASLVAQARAAGIPVEEGCPLDRYEVEDGGVTVTAGGRTRRARVLIGADGAGSLVRKQLVHHRHRHGERDTPLRLFRAELPASARRSTPTATDPAAMVYDFSLMPRGLRGYLWLFPMPDGRLNVGLMHTPQASPQDPSGAALVTLLREGLAAHHVDLGDSSPRGWPAWGYSTRRPLCAPHVLTVGDAAGIDALTGEGIAVGMEHALIAADAVATAYATQDFRFTRYPRALRRAPVGRDLTLDRHLARLLYDDASWRRWLSLILYDPEMLTLYAARVSGTLVLATQRGAMLRALGRHVVHRRSRARSLQGHESAVR